MGLCHHNAPPAGALLFCGWEKYQLLAVGITESGCCLVLVVVCSRGKWDLNDAWSALNGSGDSE
jgi:hypothetical protein